MLMLLSLGGILVNLYIEGLFGLDFSSGAAKIQTKLKKHEAWMSKNEEIFVVQFQSGLIT
jgi:hypothetical protein